MNIVMAYYSRLEDRIVLAHAFSSGHVLAGESPAGSCRLIITASVLTLMSSSAPPLYHRYHPAITCFPSPPPFLFPPGPYPRRSKEAKAWITVFTTVLINALRHESHPWALIGLDDFTLE